MSDIIQLLPDHVANQIAAGEVVQRPASVVKELMENSIDAGATLITLLIKDAGKTLIQIIDNGKGMSATDARLSFERHATSKIKQATDLFAIQTKGFRGEALASIAAIAHVEMKTKLSSETLGTHLKIEGSKTISQEVVACETGTSIAVKNLFYNIPARRNFLKSAAVETRHIINEFQRVALAHPEIGFSLYHNDNQIYKLNSEVIRKRIVAIFGKKIDEALVPINESTEALEISGFVGKPSAAKKKRGEQFFFVNKRFIKSPYLNHALSSAFEELLGHGYHPTYFLFLEVPPKSIDINIHPTKTEIKFEDEHTLYAILRASVKHSLGQYNVAPVLDFERNSSMDVPYDYKDKSAAKPKINVNPDFNPFKQNKFDKKPGTDQWESLYTGIDIENIEVDTTTENQLFAEEGRSAITYQVHSKYIVSSIKSGIVYIHQNLAHQRILYEEFLENITVKGAASQQMLFPLEINFSRSDVLSIKEIQNDLESVGFMFGQFSENSIIVKGIPVTITESQIGSIIEQLLEDVQTEIPENSFSQLDIMAKSLAKSLAIKTGAKLDNKEQEEIVNKLFECKQPDISPFGKTTFITVNIVDIDKNFGL